MNHSKKGDISLSMNFLVIIIISIVVLGMGLTLLYKLFSTAEEQKAHLDAKTEDELRRLLIDQGKQLALPFNTISLHGKESYTFGLGILNIYTDNQEFNIIVTLSASDPEGITIDTLKWLLYLKDTFTIPPGGHKTIPILVEVPGDAPKGKYIFDVEVRRGNEERYANKQKFIVSVI